MDSTKQSIDRIRDIFSEARTFPAGNPREEFLHQACGEEGELRREVESLLQALTTTGGFLSRDASGGCLADCPDMVGITIGHYHLKEMLGEGGFGEVYRAEQVEPLRRMVALKIVKLGMDTRQVLARFEAERQALARMDHPNIAQVYDAGVTESGRPYFVMELVRGIPVLDYCDQYRLSLPDRIDLFRQVCDGVQHAHQKGILHRDLKPNNILVCEEHNKPLPKVIDFGVAKSLEGRLTEQTLVTLQEQVMGTPMYMSPEQLSENNIDIDTRTDIYALGIILYELLTGIIPLQDELPGGIGDMRRILDHTELPRPSRRFHSLGERAAGSARNRQLRPQALEKMLHGDLDWIVMKAIEKDRGRRYSDVGVLSSDLTHFLRHEPVSAGPPGLGYISRKFIRRHRVGMIASLIIFITVIVGVWISTASLLRAVRESERAREQESRALSASERAREQEQIASRATEHAREQQGLAESSQQLAAQQSQRAVREGERATMEAERAGRKEALADATLSFLMDELLLRADPAEESDRDIKLRTVVDQAAERLEHHLDGQPVEKAQIHQLLGNLYLRLTEYDKARRHADQAVALMVEALGPEDSMTLACLHDQAEVMSRQQQYEEAEAQFRTVLEKREQLLGAEHPDTLRTLSGLAVCLYAQGQYEEAEEQFRIVMSIQEKTLGPDHPEPLQTQYHSAEMLRSRGIYVKSEEIHRNVLEARRLTLGVEHPSTLQSMQAVCSVLRAQENFTEAEQLQQELLDIQLRVLGTDHPDTLNSMHELARSLCAQGKSGEAEPLFRKLVEIRQQQFGAENPKTLGHVDELAFALYRQGKFEESGKLDRELLDTWNRIRGEESPEALAARHRLVLVLFEEEKFSEAESLVREELVLRKQLQDSAHPDVLNAMVLLARILRAQGRYKLAEQYYRQVIIIKEKALNPEHPEVLSVRYELSITLLNEGALPEAERMLRRTMDIQQRTLGNSHPETLQTMGALASALRELGRDKEADELDQQILDLYSKRRSADERADAR